MPYFSYQNIVEGQEVVGYHLNRVLFLRTAKTNTEGWLIQLQGASCTCTHVIGFSHPGSSTTDLGIADMMNCLQDQLHKLM